MSAKIISHIVRPEENGERLDKIVSRIELIGSRSRALHLIESGRILMNGKTVKPSFICRTGQIINIDLPEEKVISHSPENLPIEILFEDADIVVVNKPAGMVVHPAVGNESGTLVNALLHHCRDFEMKFGDIRPGIIHRIDKETSGVLVIAKNDFSLDSVARQFKARTTHRVYEAVVFGCPVPPSGRITSWLARSPNDRKKFSSVRTDRKNIIRDHSTPPSIGKWAATNYRLLRSSEPFSLLELRLETGRTHQIRVHLSELGHPIVGDKTYGSDRKLSHLKNNKHKEIIQKLSRFLLHARDLAFDHPTTGQRMNFSVPWPKEDQVILKNLGFYNDVE
ncbi:MAG: RluA family pseudouridine synthase [Bdellovibrionaceae bacterium]|nr:RluA family pseudouridine synthase [Pseudobdellovibrionaceae bacterium]